MSYPTDFNAEYVQNTSFDPALKLTSDPEFDDDSTVSRLSVVPEDVYVPMPNSHSVVPTMA
jgi:hypothetical protein